MIGRVIAFVIAGWILAESKHNSDDEACNACEGKKPVAYLKRLLHRRYFQKESVEYCMRNRLPKLLRDDFGLGVLVLGQKYMRRNLPSSCYQCSFRKGWGICYIMTPPDFSYLFQEVEL